MFSGFESRTSIAKAFFSLFGLLIITRMITFQTSEQYRALQESWDKEYTGRTVSITPTRGIIYDRWGTPLATNTTVYEIDVNLEHVAIYQNADTIASVLSRILELPYDQIQQQASIPFDPLKARYRMITKFVEPEKIEQLSLTYEEYSNLKSTNKKPAPTLRGVEWIPFLIRQYPEGQLASNVIGFVTQHGDAMRGVEKQYDELLSGVPSKSYQTGIPNIVDDKTTIPQGADLILTIDREIQMTVEDILDKAVEETRSLSGTVIVSDPKTGEILAMAVSPRIDSKNFWDSQVKYVNPAIEVVYEPGSVFKVLTMAAALDAGVVTPDTPFLDTGSFSFGGVTVYNWDRNAYGQQTMTTCMQYSLNVCLAWVAKELGVTQFYNYLEAFGIGRRSGIDLDGEQVFPLPIPSDGNLAAQSFGQAVSVAPIQMVAAISAIANDGNMMAPHVVRSIISNGRQYDLPPQRVSKPISAETARTLTNMLSVSLQEETSLAHVPGYLLAGKTGTAEIPLNPDDPYFGIQAYRSVGSNASFVGWGPVDDPKFLVYVWLEEPGTSPWGSVVAAPVFADVVKELVVLMDIPPDDVRMQLATQ